MVNIEKIFSILRDKKPILKFASFRGGFMYYRWADGEWAIHVKSGKSFVAGDKMPFVSKHGFCLVERDTNISSKWDGLAIYYQGKEVFRLGENDIVVVRREVSGFCYDMSARGWRLEKHIDLQAESRIKMVLADLTIDGIHAGQHHTESLICWDPSILFSHYPHSGGSKRLMFRGTVWVTPDGKRFSPGLERGESWRHLPLFGFFPEDSGGASAILFD